MTLKKSGLGGSSCNGSDEPRGGLGTRQHKDVGSLDHLPAAGAHDDVGDRITRAIAVLAEAN